MRTWSQGETAKEQNGSVLTSPWEKELKKLN